MAPTTKLLSQPSTSQKKPKSRTKTVKLDGTLSSVATQLKRIDPLTAFSKHLAPSSTPPPTSSLSSGSNSRSVKTYEGKGKAKETARVISPLTDAVDCSLWVDRYEPTTEEELAVHLKKVESVRQWLKEAFEGGPSGVLKKYRRILLLTGRAGTGKTSTIRVLAREMGFEILEWKSSATTAQTPFDGDFGSNQHVPPEFNSSLFARFEAFLARASTCSNIFSSTSSTSKSSVPLNRRIILLEDIPNVLHQETQTRFHKALVSLVNSPPSEPPVPVVIILSDAGMRGEERDEKLKEGRGGGAGWEKNQVVDKRTMIPRSLLGGVYVAEIGFNPIAPTLLRKALQSLLNKHFSQSGGVALSPSKEVLDVIVESANGDIRSAIMALQFACVVEFPATRKKGKTVASKIVLEAVTRREQSLVLFHLLGKVLYNKRKGDPPNSSATAKDLQREREIDAAIKDPVKLPSHLQHHERRASRVDINTLYADSPIDSSLFSLYIHQNYIQFCEDLEHCDSISEWLSWVDSSGGEAWYQANPHQFHLLALGTLHSLPSPVPRRSQKYFKPEFFSFLQKEKDAWAAVQMTREWAVESGLAGASDSLATWRAGGWSKNDTVLELGAVLKAKDLASPSRSFSTARPPKQHSLFSRMELGKWRGSNNVHAQQLDELDAGEGEYSEREGGGMENAADVDVGGREERHGGWLEGDDIEDFE